jgi:hypothetical protein
VPAPEEEDRALRQGVLLDLIVRDIQFAARFVSSVRSMGDSGVASISSICMVNYFALMIYESEPKLKALGAPKGVNLSNAAQDMRRQSRHSLKLFDDTNRGVEGQIQHLRDVIIPAHRSHFRGQSDGPSYRPGNLDLSLVTYQGLPISSSHAGNFSTGLSPEVYLDDEAPHPVRGLMEEYGHYFRACGATLDPEARSFATRCPKTT